MLEKKKANVGGAKVGDRVIVVPNTDWRAKKHAGKTGVVKKVQKKGGWCDVLFDGAASVRPAW